MHGLFVREVLKRQRDSIRSLNAQAMPLISYGQERQEMLQQIAGYGSFPGARGCCYNNQHLYYLNSFYRSPKPVEPFVNILISTVDLINVLNDTFALRAHGSDQK